MRRTRLVILGLLLLSACDRPKQTSKASPAESENENKKGIEPCSLLFSAELKEVLGEAMVEATPSAQAQAGMAVSQCYFLLPTANKSVSLTVWQHARGVTREPEEFWEERFHGEGGEEKEREGGEREVKPEPIPNLGDEAFWSGTGIGGALYVRKGNRFFRVGIGGSDDQETRIKKTRHLAEYILKRF